MPRKPGRVLRVIRNSPGIQISIYFLAFASLIALYAHLFHAFYPILENKPISWADSLLFVVESMTTVGYGWLLPFENDLTNLLAIEMMLSGVIMIFVVIPLLIAPFLSTLLAPTPPRKLPHALSGHTVIIGYEEITRSVIESLALSDHDIVIIEEDKAAALEIARDYRTRAYLIWGEYTDPATWSAANLHSAAFVVICRDERLTANIVLGIRGMVRGKIISIVDKLAFERYLRYAGADHVLSPKHATGGILARHAVLNTAGDSLQEIPGLDRTSIDLQDGKVQDLRLINTPVMFGCGATGNRLGDLHLMQRYGILVPFAWKGGRFIPSPDRDEIIDTTTSLFLFGRTDALIRAVREVFNPGGCVDARAVIAGFGDVGAAAYHELVASNISCFVVDAKEHDVEQVIGNAEDEVVLKEALIENANICIVALNADDVNIFTTLMARNLNPHIRILARANEPSSVDKLYRAGADYVALLPTIGGQTVGRIVLADLVTIILELPDGSMVAMKEVTKPARLTAGAVAKKTGVRIIGIERREGPVVDPAPDERLEAGDGVIAVGDTEQLKKFIRLL
jgi:voltage-gated potassium channel